MQSTKPISVEIKQYDVRPEVTVFLFYFVGYIRSYSIALLVIIVLSSRLASLYPNTTCHAANQTVTHERMFYFWHYANDLCIIFNFVWFRKPPLGL